jgi:hypothetical protein
VCIFGTGALTTFTALVEGLYTIRTASAQNPSVVIRDLDGNVYTRQARWV